MAAATVLSKSPVAREFFPLIADASATTSIEPAPLPPLAAEPNPDVSLAPSAADPGDADLPVDHESRESGRQPSSSDLETADLLRRARATEGAERQALLHAVIERHLGLADALANRYWRSGQDRDDLVQVARAGLVEAAQRFNPELGDFVAFAVPTITGVIKRHFRDHTWMVRPPRQTQELVISVRQSWSAIAQQVKGEPTARDLAKHAGVDAASVREAQLASDGYQPASLTHTEYVLPSGQAQDEFDQCEARTVVGSTLRLLEPDERELIHLRYYERLSQQEIAMRLGTNQMSVSRRLNRLLTKLRGLLGTLEAA